MCGSILIYFLTLFEGTNTGKALKYARNVFTKRKENRENVQDVVLLITDGRAYDRVDHILKQIRDEGTEVSVQITLKFLKLNTLSPMMREIVVSFLSHIKLFTCL